MGKITEWSFSLFENVNNLIELPFGYKPYPFVLQLIYGTYVEIGQNAPPYNIHKETNMILFSGLFG